MDKVFSLLSLAGLAYRRLELYFHMPGRKYLPKMNRRGLGLALA